jgi:hypothetical protein
MAQMCHYSSMLWRELRIERFERKKKECAAVPLAANIFFDFLASIGRLLCWKKTSPQKECSLLRRPGNRHDGPRRAELSPLVETTGNHLLRHQCARHSQCTN